MTEAAGDSSLVARYAVWVPLPDLSRWIAERYGLTDPTIVTAFKLFLCSRERHIACRYRIGSPMPAFVKALPPGLAFATYKGERIAVASNWATARFDLDLGTVDWFPGKQGDRRTLPINVLRADLDSWIRDELAEREWKAAELSNLATTVGEMDEVEVVPAIEVAPPIRSGLQGRPSCKLLVAEELRRRRAAGVVLLSQTDEATELSNWLSKAHPTHPKATPKTICNSLRAELREAVNEAKARK